MRPSVESATLSRGARRLLNALAEPGHVARPDPVREGFVIVQSEGAGISLARGAHPATALAELAAHDLVALSDRGRAAISETGLAHRRRAEGIGRGEASPFAAQHRQMARAEIAGPHGPDRVTVNERESPLAWLRRRRDRDGAPLIDAAAFEAGERLRRDLTLAAMLPSVTARWDAAVSTGQGGPRDPAAATDAVIAARQRVRRALAAAGPDFAGLLLDLCGFLKGLEVIEQDRGWPARSAKIVLRLALASLARHYGLATEARGQDFSRGIFIWIAEEERAA